MSVTDIKFSVTGHISGSTVPSQLPNSLNSLTKEVFRSLREATVGQRIPSCDHDMHYMQV